MICVMLCWIFPFLFFRFLSRWVGQQPDTSSVYCMYHSYVHTTVQFSNENITHYNNREENLVVGRSVILHVDKSQIISVPRILQRFSILFLFVPLTRQQHRELCFCVSTVRLRETISVKNKEGKQHQDASFLPQQLLTFLLLFLTLKHFSLLDWRTS